MLRLQAQSQSARSDWPSSLRRTRSGVQIAPAINLSPAIASTRYSSAKRLLPSATRTSGGGTALTCLHAAKAQRCYFPVRGASTRDLLGVLGGFGYNWELFCARACPGAI